VTRVNLGVDPAELCDQHLVAEYRELPRVFGYDGHPVQGPFRLGKGHVLWCSQYPETLADRHADLVAEMLHRGFAVAHPIAPEHGQRRTPAPLIAAARKVVQDRIVERLAGMKRPPRWTRRERPAWATAVPQPLDGVPA